MQPGTPGCFHGSHGATPCVNVNTTHGAVHTICHVYLPLGLIRMRIDLFRESPTWASKPVQKSSSDLPIPDVYRCFPMHMPNLPNGRETSPLLAGLLWLRRLSLHTLVHGRLKPLGSSGILPGAQNTHTLHRSMTPYETRSAWSLVSGSLTLASAPHCFPQSQNVGPQGARAGDPLFLSSLYTDNCYHLATVEPATGRDCDRNPRTNEAGDHRAASDPPLGRGRFACNPLLVATLIHEYYALWPFDRLGAHAGRTAVAPPRASESWARPSDAEYSQGRQIARRLAARGASSSVPQPPMEEASRASNVRSDASRVERTVDEHVSSFDGYLTLKTPGRLRFWTADDVQKFIRSSGEIERNDRRVCMSSTGGARLCCLMASSSRPFRRAGGGGAHLGT